MSDWVEELSPFNDYLTTKFEKETTTYFASESNTKVVPLKLLRQELFHPVDQDNNDSTDMLKKLVPVAAQT